MPRYTYDHEEIWSDPDRIRAAVSSSKSLRQTLTTLGIEPSSKRYAKLKSQCDLFQIELNFPDPKASTRRIPDSIVFVVDSPFGRNNARELKTRALKLGYVTNQCSICDTGDTWEGLPLSLELDHTDGDFRNNTPSNLRMLCPNCHTQTETYGSKRFLKSTECRRGHIRTEKNTRLDPRGYRRCLDCAALHKLKERDRVQPWEI